MNSGSSPHLLYRHGFFFVLRCDFGWSSCRLRRNVCTNGSLQTPQPNFCSTQVADLVNLQLGIEFSALFENPANLVRGDGINAAAERYQLYQLEIRLCCDILGSPIHSGVICPLVECLQFRCVCESGNAVLGNDCHAKAADELVDAVVDFRVNVVWSASKNQNRFSSCSCLPDNFLCSLGNLVAVLFESRKSMFESHCNFFLGGVVRQTGI